MQVEQTGFAGLLLITPRVHEDSRGFFLESYNRAALGEIGIDTLFVQDNHARSEDIGVVRGLHFQSPPYSQAKLVWVSRGAVCDVVVDIRHGSQTYAKFFSCTLDEKNKKRLFIPHGFAHGYMTLEPGTEFQYKVDNFYSPGHDGGIFWNDPDIGILWPEIPGITAKLSDRDMSLPRLKDISSPFVFGG